MVYGELGRLPLSITTKLKIIGFWANMVRGKKSKLTNILHSVLVKNENIKWITYVKNILDSSGLSFIWSTYMFNCPENLVAVIKLNLKDQFIQQWKNHTKVKFVNASQFLCWFRTSNHRLPVETGPWINESHKKRLSSFLFPSFFSWLIFPFQFLLSSFPPVTVVLQTGASAGKQFPIVATYLKKNYSPDQISILELCQICHKIMLDLQKLC